MPDAVGASRSVGTVQVTSYVLPWGWFQPRRWEVLRLVRRGCWADPSESDGQLPTRNGTVRAPAGARGCMLVLSLPVGLRLIQVPSVRPPQPWCGGQLLRCAQEAPTRIRTARPPQGQVECGPLRARPSSSINFELAIEGASSTGKRSGLQAARSAGSPGATAGPARPRATCATLPSCPPAGTVSQPKDSDVSGPFTVTLPVRLDSTVVA